MRRIHIREREDLKLFKKRERKKRKETLTVLRGRMILVKSLFKIYLQIDNFDRVLQHILF